LDHQAQSDSKPRKIATYDAAAIGMVPAVFFDHLGAFVMSADETEGAGDEVMNLTFFKEARRERMGRGKLAAVLATILMGAVIAPMPAAATITLDSSGSTVFQQTLNNPCVVGDPSCKEPPLFDFTSNTGTWSDLTSPVYQAGAGVIGQSPVPNAVGSAPDIIPTTFKIGIDVNFATGAGLEQIVSFITFHCTDATCTNKSIDAANSYQPPAPGTPLDQHNGNGFSDALLNGFSLIAGDFYEFEVKWANDTDGMEEFFIVPGGAAPVPEPATLTLLGSGLLAAGAFARRRWLGGS
jgi:hypothetical protein